MLSSIPKHIFSLILLLAVSACSLGEPATPTATPTPPPTPTQTPIPMAVIVNGEGIPTSEVEAELMRYKAAQSELGNDVSNETAEEVVLQDLVDQLLLAQGAAAEGYIVEDATLQKRIDALAEAIGGAKALEDWQTLHGYSESDFRAALRRQMAAAWMRDHIAASVPETADQVHVKQFLFYNSAGAENMLARLQAGEDFLTLVSEFDPVTQGELGWFPQGYLLEPVVEEAAFSLTPGTYSQVLESSVGYHIILVIERDPAHPLTPDAHLTLQIKAIEDWLAEQRAESTIELRP